MLGAAAGGGRGFEHGVRYDSTAHLTAVVGAVVEPAQGLLHVIDVALGSVEIGLVHEPEASGVALDAPFSDERCLTLAA